MASGDNIYYPVVLGDWGQLNSYHSNDDGSPKNKHMRKDTSVPRILISNNFIYFGAQGPRLPARFQPDGEFSLVKTGMNYLRKKDQILITEFENWFEKIGLLGVHGEPWDWLKYYGKIDV